MIGDAASTVDPLSSQGLEKALASADAAACAILTALETPTLTGQAFAHHAAWERGLLHGHARQTTAMYTSERPARERVSAGSSWGSSI